MFRKKSLAITILTLLGAAYLFSIPADSKTEQFTIPAEIAGLQLRHSSQGKDAMAKISKLHGKEIAVKNGYVAHYESGQAKAMLYVAEFENEEQARQQIDLMREKIGKGTKSFGHFRELKEERRKIYSVLGFGQIHYFYLDSKKVIWLAVDPSVAKPVLEAVLKVIK
ncbi:MAG: hypothetical protein GXO98_03750 [Nitrospirae bacterium]|nr:hypothetical protein [Nitrospirota bacterium]